MEAVDRAEECLHLVAPGRELIGEIGVAVVVAHGRVQGISSRFAAAAPRVDGYPELRACPGQGRGLEHANGYAVRPVEDYTNKYKGEQVEVALFGGEYQEGVLTAYCSLEDVPHVELNGHILIPLQNVASLHCSSRCDAPEPDWPPRGFIEDDTGDS